MDILRYPKLKTKSIPFSRVHIARLEKAGKFPKHIQIGENSIGWLESEIDAYIAERVAARDRGPQEGAA